MMRFKLWAGLGLVFIFGALAGSLGTGFYLKKRVEQFSKHAFHDRTKLLMRRLSHELDLKEKQRAEIEKILREYHSKTSELRRNVRPEIDKLRDRTFSAISRELDEDQKRAFEELRKRLRRWRPEDHLREELKRADIDQLMAQLKDHLKLTDDQEHKVRPIIESSLREQLKILGKRGQRRDVRYSIRHEMREHLMSVEEQLSKVLTAEQLVAFRRWHSEKNRKHPSGSHLNY
jgi:hypothetical protein